MAAGSGRAGGVGGYPGTFDPPTIAHLAIAEAAWEQAELDRVDLIVSRSPLGKAPHVPTFEDRIAVLQKVAASRPWLGIKLTESRLISELAAGYDAVIMGSDKWLQVLDPVWYGGSPERRDQAVASLPRVLLVLRTGARLGPTPSQNVMLLEVHEDHSGVSSTLVRAGRVEWMAPEAADFDRRTGAWSDPARYLECHDLASPSG
jgi:hypothetical protein